LSGVSRKVFSERLFFERRRGARAGEPCQRNSLTQFEAGTYSKILDPFWAPRSGVRGDPGQVVSHNVDFPFFSFSVFCPTGMSASTWSEPQIKRIKHAE